MSRLFVTDSRRIRGSSKLLDPGFRVAVWVEDDYYYISKNGEYPQFRFLSQRDAEMAMAALIREGLDNPESLREAGWERCRQVMCEALMW